YKGTCPAEVTVKDGTLGIGDYAFWDCTSLENITIPDSVISIGFCAFEDCTSLESITIPDSVTSIGGYAFENCTSLASVTIGNGVTNIGRNAFHNTAWYDNQPDGVVYAGKVAYKYKGTCPAEVTVKDGTLGISDNAFTSCTSLESITLPDSVKSIGDDAFYNCTSLASITIPSSVTSIGGYAFNKCTSLESVTIGNGVKSIGFGAFASCTSLTSISVDSDNKNYCSIDGNLYSKDQTTLIQYAIGKNYTSFAIPTGVTKIEDSAFYNCTSLKSITIPSSVTSIGGSAFDNCTSLESVTIPDSVISIGFCAFYDCTSLKSITIPSSVTSIVYNALGFYYDEDYGECKIDGFKITGYPNTEAERYANDNGFEFISLREVPTYITKISLSNTSLPIFIGKESSVKVTSFSPKSATDQTIKWSLSKSGYVQITKVNDAAKAIKFKGLKKGTVYIYARNGQGKLLGKVKVTVKQPVTKISTKTVTVSSKKSYKIKLSSYYKVLPTSADTRSVNILVNNSVRKYMSYKNGYLYVKKNAKKGTYTIRLDAKDGSGVKGYIKVKVK
ncbi:MAG: leucine-rich repeat domain-containing protein, partial [Acutalibacteraceae bacterium]